MQIRDIKVEQIAAGRNWRLREGGSEPDDVVEWEIEDCSSFAPEDTVVYSALAVSRSGKVRPLVLVREVGTYGWWGDTCEFVNGVWRQTGRRNDADNPDDWAGTEFVASPLREDPSFMGAYSHEVQRSGFLQWRDKLPR